MAESTLLRVKIEGPGRYAGDLLCAIPRAGNRQKLGIQGGLPFRGKDIWNAYELTWLERTGKPAVAVATIEVDADSPHIVESKSLKLYLSSLAMEHFDAAADVEALISRDLSALLESGVRVKLVSHSAVVDSGIGNFPGACIDDVAVSCVDFEVNPSLLACTTGQILREDLYSHLFRSNCPVTGQPDFGSVLVRYHGRPIDRAALLRYLVSYRQHNDFHESCVERIFVDLQLHCAPQELTVYGRFNRRGGLDINPFRSDFEDNADNPRLSRQ